MVAENKIAAKGGLPDNARELADALKRDPEFAFLAGKIDNARFYIASVLPEVEGKIAGIGWTEPSASTMADASF